MTASAWKETFRLRRSCAKPMSPKAASPRVVGNGGMPPTEARRSKSASQGRSTVLRHRNAVERFFNTASGACSSHVQNLRRPCTSRPPCPSRSPANTLTPSPPAYADGTRCPWATRRSTDPRTHGAPRSCVSLKHSGPEGRRAMPLFPDNRLRGYRTVSDGRTLSPWCLGADVATPAHERPSRLSGMDHERNDGKGPLEIDSGRDVECAHALGTRTAVRSRLIRLLPESCN